MSNGTVALNGSSQNGTKERKPQAMKNVVSPHYRSDVVDGLVNLLSDSFLLNIKTQNYYWNVSGELKEKLSCLFKEQQEDNSQAIDEVAKRIRALGHSVPATLIEYRDYTSISEKTSKPEGTKMAAILARDNEQLVRTICEALDAAHEADDTKTIDLLVERMNRHSRNVRDLRSHL